MNTMQSAQAQSSQLFDAGLQTHMNKVYGAMSAGLLITFATAWAVGSNADIFSIMRDPETLKPNIIGLGVMFAPLIMLFFSGVMMRKSPAALRTFFYGFSAVMGVSLSWIFVAYTSFSIAQVFLVTSIAFAGLSLWGYVTKKDLSGWGSFLMMGLIGIIVASIINIFVFSSALHFAISVIGVLIFAGLTAYDTQRIKQDYLSHAYAGDEDWLDKSATMGALSLYLNFINLFMMLLSLFGNRE
jgi:uncharacterized protein